MSNRLDELIASTPATEHNTTSVDSAAVLEAMQGAGVAPDQVITTSYCKFGNANIEALVDENTMAFIYPAGLLCSSGKRKILGKTVKFKSLDFSKCRAFGPVEYTDERGLGKFGIEFAGPGDVLLGRLHWSWQGKRFRDPSEKIMAAAEERDRVLAVINGLMS